MQSTEIAKQNKKQRPSSNVHNTHTTQEESAESSRSDFTGAFSIFIGSKGAMIEVEAKKPLTGKVKDGRNFGDHLGFMTGKT